MSPKVVVIEDDKDLTGLLRYAFEKEGFEFADTHDGLTAHEFCHREQPDAIVLDVMLPGMDGFSVCRELRKDPCLRETPVVFLTARSQEADRVRGLEIGGDDYVVKPFSRARASGAGEAAPARPGPARAGLQARRAGAGPGAARGAPQRGGRWR